MIRFIYDEAGHEIQATASGCATEIAAELGVLINISYNLMRTRSPEMAEFFKHTGARHLMPSGRRRNACAAFRSSVLRRSM